MIVPDTRGSLFEARDLRHAAHRFHAAFRFAHQSGARQFARHRHPDRARLPCDAGLSQLDSGNGFRLRQSALRLAGLPDHRQPPLLRLRSLLRLAGRLSDVADVLSVRPVCLAESWCAKRNWGFLRDRVVAARPALCFRHRRGHPGGGLSRLPLDRGRSEHRRLLAQPARAAVLAEWAAVVSLAALGAEFRCRRPAFCCARRDTGARPLVGRRR